jgi:hypothetical protein
MPKRPARRLPDFLPDFPQARFVQDSVVVLTAIEDTKNSHNVFFFVDFERDSGALLEGDDPQPWSQVVALSPPMRHDIHRSDVCLDRIDCTIRQRPILCALNDVSRDIDVVEKDLFLLNDRIEEGSGSKPPARRPGFAFPS